MSYNGTRPLADKYINGQLVDVSTASVAYLPVPAQSILQTVLCCISAAITGTDTVVTIKRGSTTLGTITLVVSGSAVGSVFTAAMTGTEIARTFAASDTLILDSDGASSTTSIGTFTAVFREL